MRCGHKMKFEVDEIWPSELGQKCGSREPHTVHVREKGQRPTQFINEHD
jgi:hypothetical protein